MSKFILSAFFLALLNSHFAFAEPLNELITQALNTHPSVLRSATEVKAAESGISNAKWQFYPTPSISIERVQTSDTDPTYNRGDKTIGSVGLNQTLWSGGRLTSGLKKAKSELSAAEAGHLETQQKLVFRVIQSYGSWLSAYLKRRAAESSLTSHLQLRDSVERRVGKGISADSDLSLAESRLDSTRAEVSGAKAQEMIAVSTLSQLIGKSLNSTALSQNIAKAKTLILDPDMLQDQALKLSPGVQRAQAQVKQAEAAIKESKAEIIPDIYVRAQHQRGNYSFGGENGNSNTRVFVGFSSSFGPGFSNMSKIRESKLRKESALAEVEMQRRLVSEQVISDYALVTAAESRTRMLDAALQSTKDVSNSYARQYLSGRKTWLDVMNATRDLFNTESQVANAKASKVAISWRLQVVTQGVNSVK